MSAKNNYEVIDNSVDAVNIKNEVVKSYDKGANISGELVLIDDKPYVELPNGVYVSTDGLAEKVESSALDDIETKVKASSKKMIYAIIGGGVGFGVAHYLKSGTKKKILFTVGGIALALGIEYVNSRKQ